MNEDLIRKILEGLGDKGVEELNALLHSMKPRNDLEKMLLKLAMNALAAGEPMALQAIEKILNGLVNPGAPDGLSTEGLSPTEASDLLAAVQKSEMGERQAAFTMLDTIGVALGKLGAAFLRGLI